MEQENQRTLGIRVRLPFCRKKNALYGENVITTANNKQKQAYSEALCREIRSVAEDAEGYQITQLYFGDCPVNQAETTSWHLMLRECKKCFDLTHAERCFRVTPEQFTQDDYYRYVTEGGGWLLIDMVSHVDEELSAAGFLHTTKDNARLNIILSDFGCRTFDLRLYYGLPGQTETSMEKSVERAIRMFGEHISLLPWPGRGTGEETASADPLYQAGRQVLLEKGFQEYKIGCFSRNGKTIRLYEEPASEWMGIGIGASSYMDGMRFSNISDWDTYLNFSDDFEKICIRTE